MGGKGIERFESVLDVNRNRKHTYVQCVCMKGKRDGVN